MLDSGYIIRNYRLEDIHSFVSLRNESAELSPDTGYLSPDVIRESLHRPGYTPEHDLFVADKGGELVGYLDINAEPKIGRVVLDCLIEPQHRRHGLAYRLFQGASVRVLALGVEVAHVNVRDDNVVARAVLEKTGFYVIRRSIELEIDLVRLPEPGKSAFPIRPLGIDELDILTDIQNRSFTGSWGFSPSTTEEIGYATHNGRSAEGVRIAVDRERPVGYCSVRIQENRRGKGWGRIGMLGVDPDYRGKGLGRELLLAGLSYLKGKGFKIAQITVDSENTIAYTLYCSVGFTHRDTSLWYEKRLD
jgi:mycothiol synthase